jgi:hypothetical protein
MLYKISYHITLYHIVLHYITSYYIIWNYSILYYVVLQYIIPYYSVLYIYMYVCMYVCIDVLMYSYVYAFVFICLYIYSSISLQLYLYIFRNIYIYLHIIVIIVIYGSGESYVYRDKQQSFTHCCVRKSSFRSLRTGSCATSLIKFSAEWNWEAATPTWNLLVCTEVHLLKSPSMHIELPERPLLRHMCIYIHIYNIYN